MECTAMRTLRVVMTALICATAFVAPALQAGQPDYRLETPDSGPPTPGPTNPNGPSN
jgi:hypothetical protein